MNKKVLIYTILLLIFAISLNVFSQAENAEIVDYKGTLKNIGGDWYLMTGGDFFQLNLAPDEFLEEKNITLETKTDIIIHGILVEEEINTYKLVYNEITLEIRDVDGNALWEDSTLNEFYKVIPKKCIGCRLCVNSCPTDAITMVKGKAVIDADKCIACGFCADGDGKRFKGCPTSAIEKVTE
jgi:ferredoxin